MLLRILSTEADHESCSQETAAKSYNNPRAETAEKEKAHHLKRCAFLTSKQYFQQKFMRDRV
jgi:hypothetical protein